MAARAVHAGLSKYTSHEVHLVDALDYTSETFKKMYRHVYTVLISKVPQLWGFFFGLIDISWLQPLVRLARRVYNSLNAGRLQKFLIDGQFDYIINSHFLPTEVAAALKRKGLIKSKIITVVTDYDVHKIWLADGVDHYAVACPWTYEKIKKLGVDPARAHVTGIPTDEKFAQSYDIPGLKKQLGLEIDKFTVLVATGSFGIGPIEEIIRTLDGIQVVVVSGHNKNLFERLNQLNLPNVKVMGLVNNMHELMAVSDVMITKPGGLSVSEAMVSQLPMIFFNAIPGQETNNIKVLKTYGIGISGLNIKEIAEHVKLLQSSKDALLTALKRTRELSRPNAVKDIISLIK